MTSFIIIIIIALFIVLVGFTWYRLEAYEGMERIIICVIGILLSWGIANILFNISSNGFEYATPELKDKVSEILVILFTPINGIMFMPYVSKIMSNIKFNEIEQQEAVKKVLILIVILVIVFFIEVQYLKYIQGGMFQIVNSMK